MILFSSLIKMKGTLYLTNSLQQMYIHTRIRYTCSGI